MKKLLMAVAAVVGALRVVAAFGCGANLLLAEPVPPPVAALTPAQRNFLKASRAERRRVMGDAKARVELAGGAKKEIDGVFNFRDLGGKRGLDGRLVRPRLLYRSARFDEVTDEGCRQLTKDLRIRTDLDLRTATEVAQLNGCSPLGTNVAWKLVPLRAYADIASPDGRKAMRAALREVFSVKNWPLAFHCKTGKDRTGTLAFVVLSLLGVDEEVICLDWERTAFHVPELSRMDHPSRYDKLLDCFMSLPGTNLTAKVEGYVQSLGFRNAEIRSFREALLAPPLRVRRVSLDVGAKTPFSILHVSDSHLTGVDDRDGEEVRTFARSRANLGRELGGWYFDEAVGYARTHGLQIVHAGDVVEYASAASLSRAKDIIRENGILACVGNHEFWRTGKTRNEDEKRSFDTVIRETFPADQPAMSFETNGVSFLMFDNAFGRVSPAVTSAFERVVGKGLPVVLICHVPFPAKKLLADWRVSANLLGEGYAKGDATTAAFIARVRGEPLVRAILCGHLHRFAVTQFSPTSKMCVANALFNGEAVEVTFTDTEEIRFENGTVGTYGRPVAAGDFGRNVFDCGDTKGAPTGVQEQDGHVGVRPLGDVRAADSLAFASPSNELTDSDRIEQAISSACATGKRHVTISAKPNGKPWLITRAIVLPSDFTLEVDDCVVQLSPGTKDNIIRNVGAVEGCITTNRNITVRGKGRAVLCGGTENHYAPNRSGDANGWPSIGILFCAVDGFAIENLTLRETQCWGVSVENGCVNGRIAGIRFEDSNKMRNQDGIDVRKGCHDIVIENVSGVCGDDVVALTALRSNKPLEAGRKAMQIGGRFQTADDDVYGITIRHIRARCAGGHGLVRLLCQDGAKMHHIAVSNIVETANVKAGEPASPALRIGDTRYWSIRPAKMGDMHDIFVSDITSKAQAAVTINGMLSDAVVRNVRTAAGKTRVQVNAKTENVLLEL